MEFEFNIIGVLNSKKGFVIEEGGIKFALLIDGEGKIDVGKLEKKLGHKMMYFEDSDFLEK
ncbi:hypothetical protein [Clostridium butyricum]|uniref:hypothetical protein n=1 Tax=Clostridium butyricum TaxID=1492 RepID=UPI002AB0EB11|nr:hypothetical protein [Clostridium butyricum]